MRFLLFIFGLYDIILIGVNTPIRRRVMYLDFLVKIPNATYIKADQTDDD